MRIPNPLPEGRGSHIEVYIKKGPTKHAGPFLTQINCSWLELLAVICLALADQPYKTSLTNQLIRHPQGGNKELSP